MKRTAVITGAGSGVGRAAAILLAQDGWQLALLGRRHDALEETRSLAFGTAAIELFACDIGQSAAVHRVGEKILSHFGSVHLLVNAAGTNVPQRSLEVLSSGDYELMMNTNLNGAYYCVQAFLPQMRTQGAGTIINIVSDAARQASPKAGPAYSMSKFGLLGLTQSINAEERPRGVRACAILPGDIDTPLLDKRPAPPNAELRSRMMQPEDIARCVVFVASLPSRAVVEELLIRPGA